MFASRPVISTTRNHRGSWSNDQIFQARTLGTETQYPNSRRQGIVFVDGETHPLNHESSEPNNQFIKEILSLSLQKQPKQKSDVLSARIHIRVGGILYETQESTLSTFPKTLLGDKISRQKYYDKSNNEYRFNRCYLSFDAILFYYQSNGILSKPASVKRTKFLEELDFFRIEHCFDSRHQSELDYFDETERENEIPETKIKEYIWRTLRFKFNTGLLNNILYSFYVFILISSITLLCIEAKCPIVTNQFVVTCEIILLVLFTIEFSLQFFIAPSKIEFITSALGVIDFATIITSIVFIALSYTNENHGDLCCESCWCVGVKKCVKKCIVDKCAGKCITRVNTAKFFRVIRIFKVTRISRGLKHILSVLNHCRGHIFVLVGSALMVCFIFSAMIHIFEDKSKPTKNLTFFDTFWFSIITATGVGYGDIYPETIAGKICGGSLAMIGVILFCLPATQMVYKFVELYYLPDIFGKDCERRQLIIKTREDFFEMGLETFGGHAGVSLMSHVSQ